MGGLCSNRFDDNISSQCLRYIQISSKEKSHVRMAERSKALRSGRNIVLHSISTQDGRVQPQKGVKAISPFIYGQAIHNYG